MPKYVQETPGFAHIQGHPQTEQGAKPVLFKNCPGPDIVRRVAPFVVGKNFDPSALMQGRNFPGAPKGFRQGLLADRHRNIVIGRKCAVMVMAVRVGGDVDYTRAVGLQHIGGIGIDRASPAFGKKSAALLIMVAARSNSAVWVCSDCPGVGTGFFPAGVILQEAGDTA
jgi:hypothetical protein